jgi:hypothetical protein
MSRNEQLKFHRSFRRCRRFVYNGKIQIITSCIQRLHSSWDNCYFQLSQSLTLCQPQSLNCIIFHTMDNWRQVLFWNHLVQRVYLPSHSRPTRCLKKSLLHIGGKMWFSIGSYLVIFAWGDTEKSVIRKLKP